MSWWFESASVDIFECMFDGLPDPAALADLSDAALVDAVGELARAENAVCARKLAALAELFNRRTGLDGAQERQDWWLDPEGAVGVELGAALGTSRGLALAQAHRGVALRDRLPEVANCLPKAPSLICWCARSCGVPTSSRTRRHSPRSTRS